MSHDDIKIALDVITIIFTAGVIFTTMKFSGKVESVRSLLSTVKDDLTNKVEAIKADLARHMTQTDTWRQQFTDRIDKLFQK